jgi:hypothetical protein
MSGSVFLFVCESCVFLDSFSDLDFSCVNPIFSETLLFILRVEELHCVESQVVLSVYRFCQRVVNNNKNGFRLSLSF